MRRIVTKLARAGVATGLAVALVQPFTAAPAQADTPVLIGLYQYTPAAAVATAGNPVVWSNIDPLGLSHNVLALAYIPPVGVPVVQTQELAPTLLPGQSWSSGGLAPGTYIYTCSIDLEHTALMRGILTVV